MTVYTRIKTFYSTHFLLLSSSHIYEAAGDPNGPSVGIDTVFGEPWKEKDFPDCHGMLINTHHVLTGASCIKIFEDNPRKLDGDYYYAFTVKMVKILLENNFEMILTMKIELIKENLLLDLPSTRYTFKICKSDQGNDSS